MNRLVSDVPNPVDTPQYTSTIKRGQRSSEALLNAAAECYLEGVSTRDIGKIFDQFGIVSMFSTQVSYISKKLDEGLQPWRNRDLEEFPYLILRAKTYQVDPISVDLSSTLVTTQGGQLERILL